MLVAPKWSNQDLRLYHGTSRAAAQAIVSGRIDLAKGRPNIDFGCGFYCTTVKEQAIDWAELKHVQPADIPTVVELSLSRELLTSLRILSFVLGSSAASDFWSLVYFCRNGGTNHGRNPVEGPYDVVHGPVVKWRDQRVYSGFDQFSFHTPRSINLLNFHANRSIMSL